VIECRDSVNAEKGPDGETSVEACFHGYDVFIDLSAGDLDEQEITRYLEALAGDAGLSGSITVLVRDDRKPPDGITNIRTIPAATEEALTALHRAIRGATRHGRHLVVVLGPLLPANEALRRLTEDFGRDPFFGMVQPRFADASNDHILPLPGDVNDFEHRPMLTRAGLSLLPDYVITPEMVSACVVIRREVVREMEWSNSGLSSIAGELRLLLCQARRRGYRNLVINRVTISTQLPDAFIYPSPPPADLDRLNTMYPEIPRAAAWCANLAQRKLEPILARACADDATQRRRVLLDCRGMINRHNGTSHCMLGLLDGFHAIDGPWQVDVLASRPAMEFFQLRERYGKFGLQDRPGDTYTAAVLLNQPWALSTIAELHSHALLVGFNMLDTISWDILYVCDERLDAVWRFIARHSDVLFYDSQFTRDRFANRFPLQGHVAERVAYLSLSKQEQADRKVLGEAAGDHILLFGNEYDHKDIRRTLRLLVDAFPYCRIVAVGIDDNEGQNVTMPSGTIEHSVLHQLIASARVIVFPSFYEGFGMPVVQGLAYGRTVVARQSPLWKEIAAQVQTPGQLVEFDSAVTLVEAVGRALAGRPLEPLPQGAALDAGQSPLRWQDCAQRMIDSLEKLLPSADGKRWLEREEALRAIDLLHS